MSLPARGENKQVRPLAHTQSQQCGGGISGPVQGSPGNCEALSQNALEQPTSSPVPSTQDRESGTHPAAPRGKGPQPSLRGTSLSSLQFKIGHEDACQDPVLLAIRRVIFLAVHCEMLDQGGLPKPTADSGCDDKTILRGWHRPSQQQAPLMCTVGGGRPYPELWAQSNGYIWAWGWGEPRGLGFLPGPSKSSTHTGMHTPAADNIPACRSLAWNGLPPLAAITVPSSRCSHLHPRKPCQGPHDPATPASQGVEIMLPTSNGVGTGGVWPERAWRMWQGAWGHV